MTRSLGQRSSRLLGINRSLGSYQIPNGSYQILIHQSVAGRPMGPMDHNQNALNKTKRTPTSFPVAVHHKLPVVEHSDRVTKTPKSSKVSPMASCKVISRLSSRLQPFSRNLTKTLPASELSQLKSSLLSPASAHMRRISGLSRLPVELGSMMPLHSAVASARLISSLSIDSQSWGLVPQGISMPL
ncbi:hypothetical protein D8674_014604 [Pyrus ussuriensis x Pyrus communis]|uniref:Uncharacterized protein n=1 Tax=Pyrus ussuriensis x Pyrus communis TaxID=2448454 RepID=A0A5N5GT08_9ROSA|nr:hypothetical protein D8674_014604 [Pyrus ussuriensis x Pyrus communis]